MQAIKKYEEWFQFLVQEEIIFKISKISDASLFPDISMEYHTTFDMLSLIIHNNLSTKNFDKFKNLKISNISIIIDEQQDTDTIYNFVKEVSNLEVDSINIYYTGVNSEFLEKDCFKFEFIQQLFSITIFNSNNGELISGNRINIIHKSEDFHEFSRFSLPEKMSINMEHFTEAQNYHSYFNLKVYIDRNGDIRNGLNENKKYQNIEQLDEIGFTNQINSEIFLAIGSVLKDFTLICKECEFRYMCIDPRVPKKNDKGMWYHSEECNYNPYISKWRYEDGYKNLKESGINLDKDGNLNINQDRLTKLFTSIWEV